MATTARTRFKRIIKSHPAITSSEMARRLGVSRQRTWAIARKMGVALTPSDPKPQPRGRCRICRRMLSKPKTLTHAACHYVQVTCDGCGVVFQMTRRDEKKSERHFHSRECFTTTISREKAERETIHQEIMEMVKRRPI